MKNRKKLVRRLAEALGWTYCAALNRLRALPAGTSWEEYVADEVVKADWPGKPLGTALVRRRDP